MKFPNRTLVFFMALLVCSLDVFGSDIVADTDFDIESATQDELRKYVLKLIMIPNSDESIHREKMLFVAHDIQLRCRLEHAREEAVNALRFFAEVEPKDDEMISMPWDEFQKLLQELKRRIQPSELECNETNSYIRQLYFHQRLSHSYNAWEEIIGSGIYLSQEQCREVLIINRMFENLLYSKVHRLTLREIVMANLMIQADDQAYHEANLRTITDVIKMRDDLDRTWKLNAIRTIEYFCAQNENVTLHYAGKKISKLRRRLETK